jgi:3-dehydroquinate synthase
MLPDNILFSTQPAADLATFLNRKNYSALFVLTDQNTYRDCYPAIAPTLPPHTVFQVPAGEEHKNINTCLTIWQAMTEQALDRHAALIVLGGGVLGDMGGFCAATYKRGIDFVLIPTTLLAQADASIGGKLGIDFNNFKNHIGVFQQPALTLLASDFLKTLPPAELRSGFAEVIKHALISDKAMWNEMRAHKLSQQDWLRLVQHSVEFKARITTEDPKEKGIRKILNAGHTIGHAVESYLLSANRRILHGEAVAIGLIAEGYIAAQKQMITDADLKQFSDYILDVFGKTDLSDSDIETAAAMTLQDKKNKGNKILCVLPEGIGKARWDVEISLDEVKRALTFYRTLQI